VASAAGFRQLKSRPRLIRLATAGLALSSSVGYVLEGAGPLGGNYAPALVTDHARHAAALAAELPPEAAISASAALVPRVSARPRAYVFPAVLDAEYVLLDLQSSPAPTSAGDVFLRTKQMLEAGGWRLASFDDGLLLLQRDEAAPPIDLHPARPPTQGGTSNASNVSLLAAEIVPSPVGAIDVDGPRWILRTVWRAPGALPAGTRLDFWIELRDGQQQRFWDVADLWWNPPDSWPPGQPVTVDVPDVPIRQFSSWRATWSDPAER
jgi:hypothetical protein